MTILANRNVDMLQDGLSVNKKYPFFSIITVTYNNSGSLFRCLDSIRLQSCKDYEIIIIDGGSTDGTIDLLHSRSDEIDFYVSEIDEGIYNAINKGIRYARGSVIGIVHSDDILSFNALERYKKVFLSGDYDMVLGDCVYFDNNFYLKGYRPARNYRHEAIFRGMTAAHEAIFLKSKIYKKFGLYDERLQSAADYKLFSSICCTGINVGMTNRVELYKHIGGKSFLSAIEHNENFKVLETYLPNLNNNDFSILTKLKNYRDLDKEDIRNLYYLLIKLDASSTIFRSISLSLLSIMLGDTKVESFNHIEPNAFYNNIDFSKDRVLFCIIAIKDIAGGAERVLIDFASYLTGQGKEVLISSADGKAGIPYYSSENFVDLLDIFEPPFNDSLDIIFDLDLELKELIHKIPNDILFVAANCVEFRDKFSSWSQFVSLCKSGKNRNIDSIKIEMINEIGPWIQRHGERVRRWRSLNKYL